MNDADELDVLGSFMDKASATSGANVTVRVFAPKGDIALAYTAVRN